MQLLSPDRNAGIVASGTSGVGNCGPFDAKPDNASGR
jgi:hypothetical protein